MMAVIVVFGLVGGGRKVIREVKAGQILADLQPLFEVIDVGSLAVAYCFLVLDSGMPDSLGVASNKMS